MKTKEQIKKCIDKLNLEWYRLDDTAQGAIRAIQIEMLDWVLE